MSPIPIPNRPSSSPAKMTAFALFLVVVAAAAATVEAFLPAPLAGSRRTIIQLQSTAIPTPIDGKAKDGQARTSDAIRSLEKLLERQRADMKMTERLMQSLKNETNLEDQQGDALGYAKSLLSGFDYGFISRSEGAAMQAVEGGPIEGYGPPGNLLRLATEQFFRNLNAIKGEYNDEPELNLTPRQIALRKDLKKLTLNSTEIWEREFADGPLEAPWLIKAPYLMVCYLLDVVFEKRYVPARFFLLETVARMPYFSYISLLHLYETIGFWRRSADIKRLHFAEEINEFRHLLIMEALGGDQSWWVRFVAQHAAIVYYFVLCFLWAISPSLSYKFSELLESHAVNTYGVFLDENKELLKKLPPPTTAVEYYSLGSSDPFYAEIQTGAILSGADIRRPGEKMTSLYDVFSAIKADEGDHVSAMEACLDPSVSVRSPSIERRVIFGLALVAATSLVVSNSGLLNPVDVDVAIDSTTGAMAGATAETGISNILIDVAIGAGAALGRDWTTMTDESGELSEIAAGNTRYVWAAIRANLMEAISFVVRFLPSFI